MLWRLCLTLVFLTSTARTAIEQAQPVYLSYLALNYSTMSSTQIQLSLPSQLFVDFNKDFITTAFAISLPANVRTLIVGFQCDFVVGRRALGSTSAMSFQWDATAMMTTYINSTLAQVRADCSGVPCPLATQPALFTIPATRVYSDNPAMPWGYLHHADFILSLTGSTVNITSPPYDPMLIWIDFLLAAPNADLAANYQYKVMQPVTSLLSNGPDIFLADPNDLLSHGWTTWTNGSIVTSSFLGGIPAPAYGRRVGAYVAPLPPPPPRPTNPTSVSNPSSRPITGLPLPFPSSMLPTPPPPPSSNQSGPIVQPPTSPVTGMALWQFILAGITAFIVIVAMIIFAIVYACKRCRRRCAPCRRFCYRTPCLRHKNSDYNSLKRPRETPSVGISDGYDSNDDYESGEDDGREMVVMSSAGGGTMAPVYNSNFGSRGEAAPRSSSSTPTPLDDYNTRFSLLLSSGSQAAAPLGLPAPSPDHGLVVLTGPPPSMPTPRPGDSEAMQSGSGAPKGTTSSDSL